MFKKVPFTKLFVSCDCIYYSIFALVHQPKTYIKNRLDRDRGAWTVKISFSLTSFSWSEASLTQLNTIFLIFILVNLSTCHVNLAQYLQGKVNISQYMKLLVCYIPVTFGGLGC